jgi:NAD(P)H dehydrogenase (quinone)
VRAIVRDAKKGEAWSARGCEVALADITDDATLAAAFEGAEGVFVVIPPIFDPTPGFPEVRSASASLKSALKTARPQKVVCLSTIGAQAVQPNLLNQLGINGTSARYIAHSDRSGQGRVAHGKFCLGRVASP